MKSNKITLYIDGLREVMAYMETWIDKFEDTPEHNEEISDNVEKIFAKYEAAMEGGNTDDSEFTS